MEPAITNILVPIDFKINCLKAIEYAKQLQSAIGCRIHLLHMIKTGWLWNNARVLTDIAYYKLEQIKKDNQMAGDTSLKVFQGNRYKEIIKYANSISARYIILADNYPLSKSRKIIGSTITKVITEAKQPVISITAPVTTVLKNLVVPIDLSEQYRLQLFNSVAIALHHSTTIHLVTVLFGEKSLKTRRINKIFDRYSKVYSENGINFTKKFFNKQNQYAYKEIINYSYKINADSILVMTHTEPVKFDNYMGAFVHQIINEAEMPVISLNNTSARINI